MTDKKSRLERIPEIPEESARRVFRTIESVRGEILVSDQYTAKEKLAITAVLDRIFDEAEEEAHWIFDLWISLQYEGLDNDSVPY